MQGGVALVTGAAKGLGRAFAECLLKRGARVCVSDVDAVAGAQTRGQLANVYGEHSVMFHKCDTTSEADMDALFSEVRGRYGGVDLVVNNAGVMDEARWERMVDVNLNGVIRGTMLGLKFMGKDAGGAGGHVINIASAAGLTPTPFMPAYSAAKTGVVAYSRAWALNPLYQVHGVRINVLCPYFADTDILKISPDQCIGHELATTSIRAVGVMKPEDVVVAFDALLDDPELNGAVMQVSVRGHKLVEFPKTGFEHLNAKL